MFWIGSVPGLLLIGGMQLAAESPRWLVKVCTWIDAFSSLYQFRAGFFVLCANVSQLMDRSGGWMPLRKLSEGSGGNLRLEKPWRN